MITERDDREGGREFALIITTRNTNNLTVFGAYLM